MNVEKSFIFLEIIWIYRYYKQIFLSYQYNDSDLYMQKDIPFNRKNLLK